MKKVITWILVVVLAAAIGAGIYFGCFHNKNAAQPVEPTEVVDVVPDVEEENQANG